MATRSMFPYAAVLAAALTLASCSGGDPATAETVPAPTVTTSSSSVPSPSSSAPSTSAAPSEAEDPVLAKIPKEARPQTEEAAKAFAAFFIASLNRAARGADPLVLAGLYDPACKTCQNMQDTIKDLHGNGEHHDGDSIEVLKTATLIYAEGQKAVRVDVNQRSVNIVDKSGRTVTATEAAKGAFAATLAFRGRHWVVLSLELMSS